MKIELKNMVSYTSFTREFEEHYWNLTKNDLVIVKNNKPLFVAMDIQRYEELQEIASSQMQKVGFPNDISKNTITIKKEK